MSGGVWRDHAAAHTTTPSRKQHGMSVEAHFDPVERVWWIPCTPELIPNLAEWSEPVQIRIHAGCMEVRRIEPAPLPASQAVAGSGGTP